jgi:hypothetical protein
MNLKHIWNSFRCVFFDRDRTEERFDDRTVKYIYRSYHPLFFICSLLDRQIHQAAAQTVQLPNTVIAA